MIPHFLRYIINIGLTVKYQKDTANESRVMENEDSLRMIHISKKLLTQFQVYSVHRAKTTAALQLILIS